MSAQACQAGLSVRGKPRQILESPKLTYFHLLCNRDIINLSFDLNMVVDTCHCSGSGGDGGACECACVYVCVHAHIPLLMALWKA